MKIIFLCGSLEPGRDGVGDYIRQLAGALLRQGCSVAGIALNDQHIVEEVSIKYSRTEEEMPVLRLPSIWPASHRFRKAKEWIEEFQPTWLSLQFVPYAFHTKGLPLLLSRHLRKLAKGRQMHIMMHESWVGTEPGTGLRRVLLSKLQKVIISNILSELQPSVVHTHLPAYRTRLQSLGWTALPLPLFSNIPVISTSPTPAYVGDPRIFRIGIFSQLHTSGPFITFLRDIAQHLAQNDRICQILLIGGEPTRMKGLTAVLEDVANLRGQVQYTGFLEPAQLSAALQTCHLGLTPVPQQGLGKSGSVAAFLAHGIPVAAPVTNQRDDINSIGFFSENIHSSILIKPDLSNFPAIQSATQLAKAAIRLPIIARKFLDDLEQSVLDSLSSVPNE